MRIFESQLRALSWKRMFQYCTNLKLKCLWMDSSVVSYSCMFRSGCACCAYEPAGSCKRKGQRDIDKNIKTGREGREERGVRGKERGGRRRRELKTNCNWENVKV